MTALEKDHEDLFRRLVRSAGGMVEKLAPTRDGIPDRLVIMPGGRVYLVELKKAGGRTRPLQKHWHRQAAERGVQVVVLTGAGEIRTWVREVRDRRPVFEYPGYLWLLDGARLAPDLTDHASHLDDRIAVSECVHCLGVLG